ncbi:MAG: hypothetical protein ACXWXR_10290 [Candidatus Limnocylindrales bacterium]
MSFDAQRLYELLPTVYRVRDAEGAGGRTDELRQLIDVIAGEIAVLEEDLEQLYDDQFIETCAEWVAPYIGDLLAYRTLYGLTDKVASPRAEVANTIAYRRRKGTAAMLEQLARDVTGWNARAVEYFQLLATTQYLNHVRPRSLAWYGVRRADARPPVGRAFDTAGHTADVRRIARGRGRHDIPNVGLHVWRIRDYPLLAVPAQKLKPAAADRRYLFSPLRADLPLFSFAEAEASITHIAERGNVPQPITRRELWERIGDFYPESLVVSFAGTPLPATAVAACDLSDSGSGWAYPAVDRVLIDPVLGRLALPLSLMVDGQPVAMVDPVVSFHYGSAADIGGGAYARVATFADDLGTPVPVVAPASIATAVGGLAGSGIVEVTGNGRFTEPLAINAGAGERIELRAADGSRPTVELTGELVIGLDEGAEVTLNGLVLVGAGIRIPAAAKGGRLRLVHCTLVPGVSLLPDGAPAQPGVPSLIAASSMVSVEIDHSIVGGIRADEDARVRIRDSIVDACDQTAVAYAAPTGDGAGGELDVTGSTIVGKICARILRLVSNSILAARLGETDAWTSPVVAERRQDGCIRFSYVPPGSRTPRRHRCQPASDDDAVRVQPQFTSERYGDPAYGQLSLRCPAEIRTGADDESEMGALHHVYAPQRETNLHVRLEEYLRFGLEAGVIHES